jgi:hypothetical protein
MLNYSHLTPLRKSDSARMNSRIEISIFENASLQYFHKQVNVQCDIIIET